MLGFDKAAYLSFLYTLILSETVSIVYEDQMFYYSHNSKILYPFYFTTLLNSLDCHILF